MAGSWSGNVYSGDGSDERIVGRRSNDVIYAEGGDDTVSGRDGDDRILGDVGNDVLWGDAGDDYIEADAIGIPARNDDDRAVGGAGDDLVSGGYGADFLAGADGDDRIFARMDDGVDTLSGGSGADVYEGSAVYGGAIVMKGDVSSGARVIYAGELAAELSGFESVSIRASGYTADDVLIGGTNSDYIEAGLGRDTVTTGDGEDTILLSLDGKLDDIDLGAGARDRAIVQIAPGQDEGQDLVVDLRDKPSIKLGDAPEQTIAGAERFAIVAGDGDDRFIGSGRVALFDAGFGQNAIKGGEADEVFAAGLDRSLDEFSGGGGRDLLDLYADFGTKDSVTVKLRGATSLEIFLDGRAVAVADGIEEYKISGSSGDDLLRSLGGDDVLSGAYGEDRLEGGGGDDLLIGGYDADRIIGGRGIDTVDFGGNSAGDMKVVLEDGRATAFVAGKRSDALSGVENLIGGGYDDTLIGDDGDNLIGGGGGRDVLNGGRGFDTLSLAGASGDLKIALKGAESVTIETGAFDSVTFRNFEGVIGSDFDDVIVGDDKSNILEGAGGADTMTGGDGADIFRYANAADSFAGDTDVIKDFSDSEGDRLDFSSFGYTTRVGDRFYSEDVELLFIGGNGFSGTAGELRFQKGDTSRLLADLDGDKTADFEIAFSNGSKITANDLIL